MKKILAVVSALALTVSALPVLAQSPTSVNAQLTTPGTTQTLLLPAAADHAGVISLGTAIDPQSGKLVEGYAIVRYKPTTAKPNNPGGGHGGNSSGDGSTCYAFLSKEAKWKTIEPWLINPDNTQGLDENTIAAVAATSVTKWEDAADGIVNDSNFLNILGVGSITSATLQADTVSPDGTNEVYFGSIADANAIAVTIVWGIFGGPLSGRELIEWDQIYDQVDFDWSLSGETNKMDFENIATHELGHTFGLADLYTAGCAEETMYGYGSEGEIKKQDLNLGDITGISKLY